MKRLIKSFNYAVEGIIYCLTTQINMRVHFTVAFIVLCTSLFFDFSRFELIALFFAITFVIIAETVNTAIEAVVDLTTRELHPLAKVAKDVGAGAVLIAAVNAVIVGYLLFYKRLAYINPLIFRGIQESPLHVTFICIILVILLTITAKAAIGKQKSSLFQGGLVSGHSAIAFSVATAITFIAQNVLVMTLAFILALLVAESRIEGDFHSVREAVAGALLGIFTTLLIFQLMYHNPW